MKGEKREKMGKRRKKGEKVRKNQLGGRIKPNSPKSVICMVLV